jgi:hypothetical protein
LSLRELFQEFIDAYLNVDSKLVHTLRALVRPGVLTREYLDGRRARHVRPLVLYLVVTALFFALPQGKKGPRWMLKMGGARIEQKSIDGETSVQVVDEPEEGATASSTNGVERAIAAKARALLATKEGQQRFAKTMAENMPRALFAIVPMVALVLTLLYLRRRVLYVEHFVFALHELTFAFIVLGVVHLATLRGAGGLVGVVLLLLPLHVLFAMRRVYAQAWGWTVVKFAATLAASIVALFLNLGALMTLSLWLA